MRSWELRGLTVYVYMYMCQTFFNLVASCDHVTHSISLQSSAFISA